MEHKTLPDTWLYKQTFSKLVPSPQLIQEVLDMTETKKRPKKFILRRLVVAALVMALATALAMGANAATGGELFKGVVSFVSYSEDGEAIMVTVDSDALEAAEDGDVEYFSIEEKGSGQGRIVYKDKDGNTVIEDIELPDKPSKEILEDARKEGIAVEVRGSADFSDEELEAAAARFTGQLMAAKSLVEKLAA